MDVEYVRNTISIYYGTNAAAEEVFEIAKRSWDRSPALFNTTFQGLREVRLRGETVGEFTFDLARVKSVVVAVAHGLALRDFGRQYIGAWHVFCASLRSRPDSPPERIQNWDAFRMMVQGAPYDPIVTPHPEVFSYGIHRLADWGFIYQQIFYGGFVVYAWPLKPEEPKPTDNSPMEPTRPASP